MDLDFQRRPDLADYLIERYTAYSKDQNLTKVLPFYKCYRAYVRGKVISFKLDDPSVSDKEKAVAAKDAQAYFKLAVEFAKKM
jgi:aminoglycoside phosphotransferase family enzyme